MFVDEAFNFQYTVRFFNRAQYLYVPRFWIFCGLRNRLIDVINIVNINNNNNVHKDVIKGKSFSKYYYILS